MLERLQVGQSVIRMDAANPFRAGEIAAKTALEGSSLEVRAALLFCTPEMADPRLLKGIHAGLGRDAPPLVGCTTPYPIADHETLRSGGVLTLLRARPRHLTLHVGVGADAVNQPQRAVDQALEGANLRKWLDERRTGFLLLVPPGSRPSRGEADPQQIEQTLLRLLNDRVRDRLFVFGGSAAGEGPVGQVRQFASQGGEQEYTTCRDAVVLAFVETALIFAHGAGDGLQAEGEGFRVDRLFEDADVSQYVDQIDGRGAAEFVRDRERQAPGRPVVMAVGDALRGYHFIRPQALRDGRVLLPREIPRSAVLRTSTAGRKLLLDAATGAAKRAARDVRVPRFVLAVSCAGRPRLFGHAARRFVDDEGSVVRAGIVPAGYPTTNSERKGSSGEGNRGASRHSVVEDQPEPALAGFYGDGEVCGLVGTPDANRQYTIAALAVGNDLNPSAALLEKLAGLQHVSSELSYLTRDEQIAGRVLEGLAQIGYAGGMISFVETGSQESYSVRAEYARSAEGLGVDWCQWDRIKGITVRDLNGTDILAEVASGREPSPVVIPDSRADIRCDKDAVRKGSIRGQIVFALSDPILGEQPFGILQIGTPAGYHPTADELAALQVFASMTAKALGASRSTRGLREAQEELRRLTLTAATGRDLDRLLDTVVRAAQTTTSADNASLRVADQSHRCFYYRAFYPQGDASWTLSQIKRSFPMEPQRDREHRIDILVQDCGKPLRTTAATRQYRESHLDPPRPSGLEASKQPVRGELAVPFAAGSSKLGVLSVNSGRRHFSAEEEYWLVGFAREAAGALVLARERVFAETLQKVSGLFLREADAGPRTTQWLKKLEAAAGLIRDAVHCDACSVLLIDPTRPRHLVLRATTSAVSRRRLGDSYPVGTGLTGGVALLKSPLRLARLGDQEELRRLYPRFAQAGIRWQGVICDCEKEPREQQSYLGVPVLWQEKQGQEGELLGVIRCLVRTGAPCFSELDERLLQAVAEFLALGLRHAQTVELERDRFRQYADDVFGHQLSKPVTFVAETLGKLEPQVQPPLRDQVRACRTELARLRRLVDNLSVLRQTGSIDRLKPVAIRLVSLVRRAADDARAGYSIEYPARTAPEVQVVCPEQLKVSGYHVFLREAVSNLVGNALKASPPKGTVTLEVMERSSSEDSGSGAILVDEHELRGVQCWSEAVLRDPAGTVVTITVQDQGPGLDRDRLARVVRPMASEPLQDGDRGLGLGLTVALATARAHGGGVVLRSKPGQGAQFTLVLPREP